MALNIFLNVKEELINLAIYYHHEWVMVWRFEYIWYQVLLLEMYVSILTDRGRLASCLPIRQTNCLTSRVARIATALDGCYQPYSLDGTSGSEIDGCTILTRNNSPSKQGTTDDEGDGVAITTLSSSYCNDWMLQTHPIPQLVGGFGCCCYYLDYIGAGVTN